MVCKNLQLQDTCTGIGPVEEELCLGSVLEENPHHTEEQDGQEEEGEEKK